MLQMHDPEYRDATRRLEELAAGWRGWLSVGSDPEAAACLVRVEAALARAIRGSLGRCTRCAEPLEAERLERDPSEPTCARCHDEALGASAVRVA